MPDVDEAVYRAAERPSGGADVARTFAADAAHRGAGPGPPGWGLGLVTGVVRVAAVLAIPVLLAACEVASPPAPRPTTPPGWTTVESSAGGLWVDLPPWIVAFDTSGSVLANEPPREDGTWIQVLAMPPDPAGPQAASAAEAQSWLEDQFDSPNAGPATVRTVDLPGGSAIRFDRVDGAGTPQARRFNAYAFQTPTGLALLVIDGAVDAWTGREADLELIPQLIRFGVGHAGADAAPSVLAPVAGAAPEAP